MFGCKLRCTCETTFAIDEVAPGGTCIIHLESSHWIWLHFRNILCHERQWKHHKQRADHGQLELFGFSSPWASKIALKSMAAVKSAVKSNFWVAQCEDLATKKPQLCSRTSERDKNTNTCDAVPAVLRTAQAHVVGCGLWDVQGFPIFVFIIFQYFMVKTAQKGGEVRDTQRSFSTQVKSLRVWKYLIQLL